jgi:tetratricopeptide (TPR) repeat protein
MIARFAPVAMFALAVTPLAVAVGCPQAAPIEASSPAAPSASRAAVTLGEPTIVAHASAPAPPTTAVDDRAPEGCELGEVSVTNVPCLEEAVAAHPGRVEARQALARHYLANDAGHKARAHADELVRQRPFDPSMRQLLGRALMQQRMWREAIAAFRLVVTEDGENIFAHNNLGYSALQIGELQLAREHLERTLSLEPQQGYMLNNLGVTYERLGRAAEAHAAFSRAAELSPRYLQAQLNRDRLQASLTQDERITSSETLLSLREPALVDGAVPFSAASETGGDLVHEAMEAAAGGSARLAPSNDGVE